MDKITTLPDFVSQLAPALQRLAGQTRGQSLEEIKKGIFFVDTYSEVERSKINVGCARMNEILSEDSSQKVFEKIDALLS